MDQEKLICVIGDEDTVTGFLLAGVGQKDARGANYLVVDASESPPTHRHPASRQAAWESAV